MRMLLIIAGAMLAGAGLLAGGYAAHGTTVRTVTKVVTRTVTRTVPKTVTVVRTAPPKVVTKTVSGAPCVEDNGAVVPAVGAALGTATVVNCTMAILPDVPAANGDQLVMTAPDGTSVSYQLGSPSGG